MMADVKEEPLSLHKEEPMPLQASRDAASRHRPPYYEYLGVELDAERTVAVLPSRPVLTNSRGAIHGGALASLLDAALAQCIRGAAPPGTGVATIDMSVHFLRPATGPSVTARGEVLRIGRSVAYAEAKVRTADGDVVAHAVGSFRLRNPRESATGASGVETES